MRPDMILADVVMPGMSGYEVCEAIKADPNLRHVPVLLLTGTFEAFDAGARRARRRRRSRREAVRGPDARRAREAAARRAAATVAHGPRRAPRPLAPRTVAPRRRRAARAAAADAFDFFGDADAEALPAADFSREADGIEPLDFDEPDAAFAFGDDELSSAVADPRPARR